jgi:hypothetical protein
MENHIGDVYSQAIKGVGRLEKEVIVELFSPISTVAEPYFGLPATTTNMECWDFPFFSLYKFILSNDIGKDLLELFALLSSISSEATFSLFKAEYYRLFGLERKFSSNPDLRYAGRIAQMWAQASDKEKQRMLEKWYGLFSAVKKTVTYSFFPLSSLFKREMAADPTQKSTFLISLNADLVARGAIPKGAHVVHKRIKEEDWFWFGLCAQNGKVCKPCCRLPGVVVYNRKHGLLRTSNIVRDVHHLRCVIHCFGTAFFGDGESFVTMNKKLMKHFNIWGIQRLIGEKQRAGRPELVSMAYSTYDTSDATLVCGNGNYIVMKLSDSEEVGYVQHARFVMDMSDYKGRACRKEFTVFSGNTIEFERGSEENLAIDWLVEAKIVKTGSQRDTETFYCGDIQKRVNWMDSMGILDKPCALWQFRELFGEHFKHVSSYLSEMPDGQTDHFRERNGASITVIEGSDATLALWDGRVWEKDYFPIEDERDLKLHTLTPRGKLVAKAIKKAPEPGKIRKVGRVLGDNADGVDMDELIREINKRIEKGQSCNAACTAVHKKFKLTIDVKSLTRKYRRWMKMNP